jgi:methylenetetrahydrofolate dehydrogenase (NAD+)
MSTDPTGKGLLLKADVIADTFRDETTQTLKSLPKPPRLVGILATSAAPSRFYAEFTRKQCESLGFDFVLKEIGAALSPENGEGDGVEEAIMEANEDENVDGIMVRSFAFRGLVGRELTVCWGLLGLLPDLWQPTGMYQVNRYTTIGGLTFFT